MFFLLLHALGHHAKIFKTSAMYSEGISYWWYSTSSCLKVQASTPLSGSSDQIVTYSLSFGNLNFLILA